MSNPLIPIEQLFTDFANNKSWDKQYRLIIQLGKKLPALDESEKTELNQIKGCESLAWCCVEKKGDLFHFKMDSDTRVVKGLMMILLIIFQDKSRLQIAEVDIKEVFEQLGLLNHLSPSRTNGLLAIVEKIKIEGEMNAST
ncbi:SufE family protein [Psychromonas hadalis]|uniref:SufE family protein n=1 Tax=Psychromonas hadalis TaxID=211669 RepID=UPI0003B5F076|nr:SufE family protein [Psychromonas hadalis]